MGKVRSRVGDLKGLGKAKRRKGLEKGEPKETKPLAKEGGKAFGQGPEDDEATEELLANLRRTALTQMRMGKFGLRKTLAKGSAASSSADHLG